MALALIKDDKHEQVLQVDNFMAQYGALWWSSDCTGHPTWSIWMQEYPCVQVFEDETKRIADPGDFKYGMGQRRLAFLFVIDAVCIGNTKHEQTSVEARQELVDTLAPHLPAFVDRLATPSNCDRVRNHALVVQQPTLFHMTDLSAPPSVRWCR